MFGKEAMKYLDYVECYPEGYRRGVEIAKACEVANIQGFPSWIINDQVRRPAIFKVVLLSLSPFCVPLSYTLCCLHADA